MKDTREKLAELHHELVHGIRRIEEGTTFWDFHVDDKAQIVLLVVEDAKLDLNHPPVGIGSDTTFLLEAIRNARANEYVRRVIVVGFMDLAIKHVMRMLARDVEQGKVCLLLDIYDNAGINKAKIHAPSLLKTPESFECDNRSGSTVLYSYPRIHPGNAAIYSKKGDMDLSDSLGISKRVTKPAIDTQDAGQLSVIGLTLNILLNDCGSQHASRYRRQVGELELRAISRMLGQFHEADERHEIDMCLQKNGALPQDHLGDEGKMHLEKLKKALVSDSQIHLSTVSQFFRVFEDTPEDHEKLFSVSKILSMRSKELSNCIPACWLEDILTKVDPKLSSKLTRIALKLEGRIPFAGVLAAFEKLNYVSSSVYTEIARDDNEGYKSAGWRFEIVENPSEGSINDLYQALTARLSRPKFAAGCHGITDAVTALKQAGFKLSLERDRNRLRINVDALREMLSKK